MGFYCKLLLCISLLLGLNLAKANNETIESTSIAWEKVTERMKLLSEVPGYEPNVIQDLFYAYQHPNQFQFPTIKNEVDYNVLFIQAFFGPINHPLRKLPRPAKVFFIFTSNHISYRMLPIFKNNENNNYYVFDRNSNQPLLLQDLINEIKKSQQQFVFNICNGYGVSPSDSCLSTYNQEASSIKLVDIKKVEPSPSAIRAPHVNWQEKVPVKKGLSENIYMESVDWEDINSRNLLLNTVTEWPNYKTIQANFEKIRDFRYFEDNRLPQFKRRITWLFPDDGCWTRAAAMIKDFFGPMNNKFSLFPRPSKLFAFGNLCVLTNNHPNGRVSWWYHTAPIVKDQETKMNYVLDPSVNPLKPLALEEWLATISSNTDACKDTSLPNEVKKISICNGYGTSPMDVCNNSEVINFYGEILRMVNQEKYRESEYYRQKMLGRDVEKVLGDQPPW